MSEDRRMFTELMGNLDDIRGMDIQHPLEEIASGFSCFGPLDGWVEWYHYLLAALVPRSHEAFVWSLLEYLVTGFVGAYPNGIDREPYRGFGDDVLATLGRCMMNAECWNGRRIKLGQFLHRSDNNPAGVWTWWNASGDFSASMFLCLKYLPEHAAKSWFASVLDIPDPHWRAQVMVRLVGAHGLLSDDIQWPSQFHENAHPDVSWAWSHSLGPDMPEEDGSRMRPTGPLLPRSVRETVLSQCFSTFSEDIYLDWLTSIDSVPYLATELAGIPDLFEALYVGGR